MLTTTHIARRLSRRAAPALAAATAALAALAPASAHAGTYFDYAGDPAGVNLPAPSLGDWGFYNTNFQVQRASDFTTRTTGASITWRINYPTGLLSQNTGVGVQLQIPASGPKAAISINRVWDWTTLDLRPLNLHGAPEAAAIGLNTVPTQGTVSDSASFNGTTTQGAGHDSGVLAANTKSRQIGVFCAY